MAPPGFAVDGVMLSFAFAAGTFLFAVGATTTLVAIRLSLRHPRDTLLLAGFGILAAFPVGFLWLDGRIGRYFATSFWVVVALGFPVGAATPLREGSVKLATSAWIGAFAVIFAFHLPMSVRIGSAAVIGFVIEALAVTFTAFPVVLAGAASASLARTHSTELYADD